MHLAKAFALYWLLYAHSIGGVANLAKFQPTEKDQTTKSNRSLFERRKKLRK